MVLKKNFEFFFGTPASLVPLHEKMTHKKFWLDWYILTHCHRPILKQELNKREFRTTPLRRVATKRFYSGIEPYQPHVTTRSLFFVTNAQKQVAQSLESLHFILIMWYYSTQLRVLSNSFASHCYFFLITLSSIRNDETIFFPSPIVFSMYCSFVGLLSTCDE